MTQTRLFCTVGKDASQPLFAALEAEFEEDGLPLALIELDEDSGLQEISLYVDGDKTGEGRVEATVPMLFSADETCDVGSDTASPVSGDYTVEGSRFTGTVEWVQLDIAEAADHMARLKIRHLPVVQEGELAGIISIRDLTNWAVHELTSGHELPDLERSHTALSAAAEVNRAQ